jgi:hypothetical protein
LPAVSLIIDLMLKENDFFPLERFTERGALSASETGDLAARHYIGDFDMNGCI